MGHGSGGIHQQNMLKYLSDRWRKKGIKGKMQEVEVNTYFMRANTS